MSLPGWLCDAFIIVVLPYCMYLDYALYWSQTTLFSGTGFLPTFRWVLNGTLRLAFTCGIKATLVALVSFQTLRSEWEVSWTLPQFVFIFLVEGKDGMRHAP